MKPLSCLRPVRTALPAALSDDFAVPEPSASQPHRRFAALALVVPLALLAGPALAAQQGWPQSPQYANPPYVQANPNPAAYPQNQPQAYPQQQYAQQPQYGPAQGYPQQGYPQQQQAYPQPQYLQQPYADPGMGDPQQAYAQGQQGGQPFAAEQLEQMVAPIALYPDALVAEILAAATYPAQVIAADNWIRAQGYASADQIAAGADAQADWDPSVKALTAFPQVLDLMNRDLGWTTDLGNAYYNQPQDVLATIQLMRQRAEDAGTLRNTPQESMTYEQGNIELAPPTAQVVYVPAYNPWDAYGQPVQPYPGFSPMGALDSFAGSGAVRYGLGIAMSAFSHTPFGWAGWALNWLTSSIFYNQSPYSSQSTTVARWGGGRGGYYGSQGGGINRTPNGYDRPQEGLNRLGDRFGNQQAAPGFTRPPVRTQENYGYNRGAEAPNRAYAGNYVRPAMRDYTVGRPQAPVTQPVRPQAYARAGGYGYGNGYPSNSQQAYAQRPAAPYGDPRQGWRAPAQGYQRNDLAQRSSMEPRPYAEPRSYTGVRGYAESYSKPERGGGMHLFGGGHGGGSPHFSYKAPKAPKAPKMSGGGHHGGGGGGHHGGGGGLFGHHGR